MSRYNVLWIDDEHEKLSSFIIDAELCGIDITPYSTSKEGMKAFEDNLLHWDSVILDAKCWNESSDETASTDGMYLSLDKITELKYRRAVPVFVYTGQPDLHSDEQFSKSLRGRRFYKKGSPAEKEQLFFDIKLEADKLVETQIRHKYSDIIGNFTEIDIELIKILCAIHNNTTNDPLLLNAIRKIVEWIMPYCVKCGILLIEWKKTNISECSGFLGRKELQEFVPIHIQRSIHSLSDITNPGSHRSELDDIVKSGYAPYLLRSTVFELLNVLYWCKSLPSDPASIEAMRAKTAALITTTRNEALTSDVFEGVIGQNAKLKYFCGEYIFHTNDMSQADLGKQVKINIKKRRENTDPNTNKDYPYFVYRSNCEILD